MKRTKKKKPNDYPLFSFRLKDEDKAELNVAIEKLVSKMNKTRSENEKVFRKNDVIIESLRIGLKILERKFS